MAKKESRRVLIVHGPNLDRLGSREKDIYGDLTLGEIDEDIRNTAEKLGVTVEIFQSNSEGDLVAKINSAGGAHDFLIINPAAYTHSSHAIRDAIAASKLPAIEVHLSNVGSRETFRRSSAVAPACVGAIAGFGVFSYLLALEMAVTMLESNDE